MNNIVKYRTPQLYLFNNNNIVLTVIYARFISKVKLLMIIAKIERKQILSRNMRYDFINTNYSNH